MKISLRKWKCLRWLDLGPPLSWSHVRTEAGGGGSGVGGRRGGAADLGWLGLREIHMAWAGSVTGPDSSSGWRAEEGKQSGGGGERGGGHNEVASPVNNWSQGYKVSDAK